MNQARQIFRPNNDGGYDMTATGVLILAADTVYGDPDETTPEGQANATKIIDGILNAAYKGGFFQGDVLHTLLARNKPDARTIKLCQDACDAAGSAELTRIISEVMN